MIPFEFKHNIFFQEIIKSLHYAAFRKQRNTEKETTEHFINGELMEREQWFLDESKSIVEFYKNGELESKQIIQNRYSLASEITAHYNASGILTKTEKLREKDGILYKDIYNSKGKLIKTEKLSAKTGIGENEGSKRPSPEIK